MDDVEFDPIKRRLTLEHRGLDMARAAEVFGGPSITVDDERRDYGEQRFMTVGYLDARMVMIVWTQRGPRRRVISLRKTNGRETPGYRARMGGS